MKTFDKISRISEISLIIFYNLMLVGIYCNQKGVTQCLYGVQDASSIIHPFNNFIHT